MVVRREFLKGALGAGIVSGGQGEEAATKAAQDAAEVTLPAKAPRMMFYHDGRHPLIYMYEPPIQKEQYESAVDELVGTPVEAIMFCLGDGRTVLHDTQVGELWGDNVEKWPHLIFRRAHQNAKQLIQDGHDPLQLVCDRAHAKGMLLYPTLLVQQGRGERGQDTRCSDFRFDNTHLEIGAADDVDAEFPGARMLDFKHPEVREERFALIEETLTRYPVDGFELQLNYGLHYFHPREIDAGRAIMSDWVERVYRAVKASGENRELVIRLPASLEGCHGIGLDVREWLRRGIVDVLVAQSHAYGELLDQNAEFEPFVGAAADTKTRVHAAIQSRVDSDRLGDATTEMIRAAAANAWDQGVDGLYLVHWFGYWPYQAEFYEKLREVPDAEIMAPRDKNYYLVTATGRYPEPRAEPGVQRQLPATLQAGQPAGLTMRISDDLPRWEKVGRVHEVLLRIRVANITELDRLTFRLNGKELPPASLRKINQMYRMSAPRYRTGSCYWYVYTLDGSNWPRKGLNEIEITLLRRDPEVVPDVLVRDVELQIQYLMGKHFHRGQDIDLGRYEPSGY
tara:strand:+ start:4057 stop:5757 length:1701 start_codon:yes stop_codon:yes gene_type:complete